MAFWGGENHRVRLLLSVLAFVVLFVGGLALFWWVGGPDVHRWVARQTLELVLEREVHVDGTLELEFAPEPLLELTGVRIASPAWAETPNQVQFARARVQIALRPLLRRVLVFPLIDLEGVTIALETAADGRRSWQSDGGQAGRPPAEPRFALPLVGSLSVKDAIVTHHDQRDGRRTRVHIVSLAHRRGAPSGEMRLDASGDINGEVFRVAGTSGNPGIGLGRGRERPAAVRSSGLERAAAVRVVTGVMSP